MKKPRQHTGTTRLKEEGWDRKEPTEVIDLALERLKKGAATANKDLRRSRESMARTSRELHGDIESALRSVTDSEPPPADEEAVAASL